MLKRLLNYRFHVVPLMNPFIYYDMENMGDYIGTNNEVKRETKVLVSLTSYNERFKDLPKTLYSLLNQTFKPDKIILWLDDSSEDISSLPYEITRFIKNGLEIRFVEDIKSYTKLYYALKEYSDYVIVTADDDIYYRKDWLEKLYYSYIANPDDIHVHRAHRVKTCNGEILAYEKWQKHVMEETAEYDNFLTGVGGVLYPPNCFNNEVYRKDVFLKNAPNADDIWFWIMALMNNKKIRVVKKHHRTLISTNIFRHLFGRTLYNKNSKGENDTQLANLMKYYKQNVLSKIL